MNRDEEARSVAYGAAFLAVCLACGILLEHWATIADFFVGFAQ